MGKKNCRDTYSHSLQGGGSKRQTRLLSDLASSFSPRDHPRRERLSRIRREVHCSPAGLPGREFATNRKTHCLVNNHLGSKLDWIIREILPSPPLSHAKLRLPT